MKTPEQITELRAKMIEYLEAAIALADETQDSTIIYAGSPSWSSNHHQQSPRARHSRCECRCHSVEAAAPNGAAGIRQPKNQSIARPTAPIADFCNKICLLET
jgi:hypothetical protein